MNCLGEFGFCRHDWLFYTNENALLSCYHLDGPAYNIEIYYEVRPMRGWLLHHIHQLHHQTRCFVRHQARKN